MDIIFLLAALILGVLFAIHIFRRIAAPFRIKLYLKSGDVVTLNVEDFTARADKLEWTISKWAPQVMTVPSFEDISVVKIVDRRFHF